MRRGGPVISSTRMVGTVEINEREEVLGGGPGPDPLVGRTLLHYRVLEVIGQGGMSVVYRGRDEHLHRDVAVKVLHPFLREKAECRARLAREARAVARLEHPHILKVFDYSGDRPTMNERPGEKTDPGFNEGFIVTELVKGRTLKRYVEQNDLFRLPEVGAIVVWQIARALEHAHAHGVIHRDIKPENVMVRDDGVLKLMDFGIAHVADQSGLTITGTLLGSPAHMAPECIEGYPADLRSDLYSLGTVLYWITTGSLPYEALTPHALLKAIVDGTYAPAQQRQPRISDDLIRVLDKSIAKRPDDRYQTAAEFAVALEGIVEKAGLLADSQKLRALLADPGVEIPAASLVVRRAFLDRAATLIDDGAPARALSALGRVLSEHAGDPDATALLERAHSIHSGDDEDEEADGGAHARRVSGEATASRLRARRTPLLGRALLVVGATALVGSAVGMAMWIDAASSTEEGRPALVQNGIEEGAPQDFGGTTANIDPPPVVDPPPPTMGGPLPIAKPEGRDPPLQKRIEARINVAPAVVPTRSVTLRVFPAARIVVDGKPVSDVFQTTAQVDLPLGKHVVVFEHPAAKEEREEFVVDASGPAPVVTKRLEPKPAMLVVSCAPDCEVEIDGTYKGVGSASRDRPIIVPLETGKKELEVGLFKKGFRPKIQKHVFAAGRTDTIDVVLEPDADGPGGSRTKKP